MNIVRNVLLILVMTALTACGVAGKKFVRPSGDLIQLGKTTENQVIAAMGDPVSSDWGERRGKKIKIMMYIYVSMPGSVALNRGAFFYFSDEVLVGHYFTSDFSNESTDFDLTKLSNIVEGKSTRRDVEAALGEPAGEAIYPFLDDKKGRLLWYKYYGPMGDKNADFELDKDGIVRHFSVKVIPKKK